MTLILRILKATNSSKFMSHLKLAFLLYMTKDYSHFHLMQWFKTKFNLLRKTRWFKINHLFIFHMLFQDYEYNFENSHLIENWLRIIKLSSYQCYCDYSAKIIQIVIPLLPERSN